MPYTCTWYSMHNNLSTQDITRHPIELDFEIQIFAHLNRQAIRTSLSLNHDITMMNVTLLNLLLLALPTVLVAGNEFKVG